MQINVTYYTTPTPLDPSRLKHHVFSFVEFLTMDVCVCVKSTNPMIISIDIVSMQIFAYELHHAIP
jgi:hypothetical protein